MSSPQPTPWYRQPWPWFLIALPAVAVCASFYTLYLALSAPEALVRDEYDRNGLEVTRRLGQDARARELGLEVRRGGAWQHSHSSQADGKHAAGGDAGRIPANIGSERHDERPCVCL